MAGNGPKDLVFDLDAHEQQLVEVARAEAMLNKRDPEEAAAVARAQIAYQRTARARNEQAAQLEAAAKRGRTIRRRKQIAAALIVVVAGAAAVPLVQNALTEKGRADALRARLDALGKDAAQAGFVSEKEWVQVPAAGVSFQVPRDTCAALVAAREGSNEPLTVEIEREFTGKLSATGGVVWCTCDGEKVTVKVPDTGGAQRALRVMSAATGRVGGIEVLRAHPVPSFRTEADKLAPACAEAGFQAWADGPGHGDIDPLDAKRPGTAADLLADGLEPVGLLASEREFAVVRAKKGRCYVAAPEKESADLTLRGPDGARLVQKAGGAVAWCAHSADGVFSLWRAGTGSPAVVVVDAPAARIGGIMGARAAAQRRGYQSVEIALLPDDLAKDARAALVAATVPEATIVDADATGLPGKPENAVVAFTLRDRAALIPVTEPAVPTACLPEVDPNQPLRASLCAGARPQVWRSSADARQQGAVEGARPYWLTVLGAVEDIGAVRASAALMAFAQRLTLLGYDPTTSDGVKDTPEGAVVSGRGGKSEAIAVGISRTAPWVVPLTEGPRWTLEGPLHVVRIPVGSTMTLRGAARLDADPKARRVVVWRR